MRVWVGTLTTDFYEQQSQLAVCTSYSIVNTGFEQQLIVITSVVSLIFLVITVDR